MKTCQYIRILAVIFSLISVGCEHEDDNHSRSFLGPHDVVVNRYQEAQRDVYEILSRTDDVEEFDVNRSKLENTIKTFDSLAISLKKLKHPNNEIASRIRHRIEEGNKATEPAAGAILKFTRINGRQGDATKWLTSFLVSARKVEIELDRLYPDLRPGEAKTVCEF